MNSIRIARWLALPALILSPAASAHIGVHTGTGFMAGFAHPFLGFDHLLAMLAVGLWAAQMGGRARWAVPAAFITAMSVGMWLAWVGAVVPQVGPVSIETGITLSVLVLGVLIGTRQHWSLATGMALAAGFALCHGYAHGLEMPGVMSPSAYAAGLVLATAVLHAAGVLGAMAGRRALEWAGWAIAVVGATLVFTA